MFSFFKKKQNPWIISHTVAEWAELPDEVSKKDVLYVYSDYRTDNDVDIPRVKIGDGKNKISCLPFATAAIADSDIEDWDQTMSNDFGNPIIIDERNDKFVFPSDGYLILMFDGVRVEHAEVRIYGANSKLSFKFSKYTDRDNQTKEVFVRKGMRCQFVAASEHALVMYQPLV